MRDTVAPMDGNVHLVGSCYEAQALDDELGLAVAGELARFSSSMSVFVP